MELLEISDLIDTKLNTFSGGLSVDEYEKSLYLTQAQLMVYNEMLSAFESSGDLSKEMEPFLKETILTTPVETRTGITIASSIFFILPADVRKLVYEEVELSSQSSALLNGKIAKVIFSKLSDVSRKLRCPFNEPNYEEVIRVSAQDNITVTPGVDPLPDIITIDPVVELLPPTGAEIAQYRIKYLEKVPPIILEDLPDDLNIEGVSTATNSKYNSQRLNKIIDLAVTLILRDKSLTTGSVSNLKQ